MATRKKANVDKAISDGAGEFKKPRKQYTRKAKVDQQAFTVITSNNGSDFIFPTVTLNEQPFTLIAPGDRWAFVPAEIRNNPYLLDAVNAGYVSMTQADKMPQGALRLPEELSGIDREWLRNLLYTEYGDAARTQLEDWRSNRYTSSVGGKPRILMLQQRILPLVRYARQFEQGMKNRANLLSDLDKVENFIVNEEWSVQSTGRRS